MSATRVLQLICPAGFYGAERWILALANNLDPQRVRCDLAVTRETSGPIEIAERFATRDGAVFELPMHGRFDPAIIGRLCRLIRERDIDIIHSHGYKADILGLIAARRTGIRALSTPHGFENSDDWKLRLYLWLGSRTFRHFDAVAPLSPQLCEDVIGYGARAERVHCINNGVDLTEVEAVCDDPAPGPEKTGPRIGYIGQLIGRKNIDALIEVFDHLWRDHPGAELCLIGDGDDRARLEARAAALPSGERIRFLGFRDDRLAWLKTFDCFAMTSTLEGIPRCLMEAMAMGVPVSAYRIPGIDRLIRSGENGLLAPLHDTDTLLEHWRTLLLDPQTRQTLVDQARQRVLRHFSAERMAEEYGDLYDDLLSGPAGARKRHV